MDYALKMPKDAHKFLQKKCLFDAHKSLKMCTRYVLNAHAKSQELMRIKSYRKDVHRSLFNPLRIRCAFDAHFESEMLIFLDGNQRYYIIIFDGNS